jgi:RNA polymerase sigma-70 factor (ECF subfamily)
VRARRLATPLPRCAPSTVSGLDGYLYFHSTRGELLRRLGRAEEAREAYDRALELATSIPERRFLTRRLEQL